MTSHIKTAREVLDLEIAGLQALHRSLDHTFDESVALLAGAKGKVVVTGMGKSGHVAKKIAATFSSTGAASLFVHPAEASHGDLGMVGRDDVVLALSKSGETQELQALLSHCARFSIPLAAMTFVAPSTLADHANVTLLLPDAAEACGETRAPTTSTTMMMAAGDALAVALLRQKGFTASDFQGFHPGGNLGAALRRVGDLMHGPERTPIASQEAPLNEAVDILDAGGFGCVGLVDENGALQGIITDGDLRRGFSDLRGDERARDVMTRNPKTVRPDTLAGDALAILSKGKITALFVLENDGPVGLLHVHDCLSTGIL
ncbi:MAG: KpsF/GutQ family sugar-phosphate isomerase [Pseudomonadota bacterium]